MHLPAARLMGDVKDTTGAGDCFTGYFLQGLMEYGPRGKVGEDIREYEVARILKTCVYVSFCDITFQNSKLNCLCRLLECASRGGGRLISTKAEVETRMLTIG
jgi:ribokinase